MSLNDLKKNSQTFLNNTRNKSLSLKAKPAAAKDERWWKLTTVNNEGEAIIRFLPPCEGEDESFILYHDYSFKGPTGKSYWEKSLRNIGQSDPVAKLNSEDYKSEDPNREAAAKKRTRRDNYVANILVINDKANPENNGKVFLFRFGKQVFAKIDALMFPDEPEEGMDAIEPGNPFDFWAGNNFKLKAVQKSEYPNYESSKFAGKSSLYDGDDDKLEEVYKNLHSLKEFNDPANYKSYEELEKRLFEVLEIGTSASPASRIRHAIDKDSEDFSEPSLTSRVDSTEDEGGADQLDNLLASLNLNDD